MAGNDEAVRPADLHVSERYAYRNLLGRYGVREDSWQPVKGMTQTLYVAANSRQGQAHILQIGDMGLILIATASGEDLYLDLNITGERLPYTSDSRQMYVGCVTARFGYQRTRFEVGVRPESGYTPKGIDAELSWLEDDRQMVRLLVAPDFCAIVERTGRSPERVTLSPGASYKKALEVFHYQLPETATPQVAEDPWLAHFVSANAHTMSVGGVFRTF